MKAFLAFWKKEWLEMLRTGKMTILLLIFVLFGIMNPALAKITPWLVEMMADSLEESGLVAAEVTVDAMTSWTQFYKNIPLALLIFVLLWSGLFTSEYQKGTLVTVVTRRFSRWKIAAAKSLMLFLSWTVCYWLCFGITYGYNAYFWDNCIVVNSAFAAVCWWLFGLWTECFLILFSALADTNIAVLLGTGGAVLLAWLAGFLPQVKNAAPVKLIESMPLLTGISAPEEYYVSMIASAGMIGISVALSVAAFEKKRI